MEFPAHWSLPVIKTEPLHVKHCETDIPPGLTQTVKLHESAQQDGELVTRIKLESTEVQQVETCNATTPSLVVVKREPSDLGIEAGIAAVTQQEDGMELAVHKGSCIKAEPPESTSAQQQTENLSNDSFDDVPVISDSKMVFEVDRADIVDCDKEDVQTSEGEEFPSIPEEERMDDGCSDDEDGLELTESQPFSLQNLCRQFFAQNHSVDGMVEEGTGYETDTEEITNGIIHSRDGLTWSTLLPARTRSRMKAKTIYKKPPTQIPNTASVSDPVDSFRLILSDDIIDVIVENTNIEGKRMKQNWRETDAVEIQALIGSLLIIGTLKQNMLGTDTIWDSFYGNPMVRAGMGCARFTDLMTHLRFDNKETRSARRVKDVFAPSFRDVWEAFMKNLGGHYIPGPFLTVDEQVVPFRGRCNFLQSLSSRPDRYGIKIFWAADCENNYPVFGIPYLGKEEGKTSNRQENLRRDAAIKLATPFYKSGRNVTCNDCLMDMELASTLLKNGVTCVGTVQQNKRFLPDDFKEKRGLPLHKSKFVFRDDTTLAYYQAKRLKSVVVLSTMHHDNAVDPTSSKNEPDMVTFYKCTRGTVGAMNKMAHAYTTKRKTQRWPMVMFFNVIDLSAIASRCIWVKKFPDSPLSGKDARCRFIRDVGEQLMQQQLRRRAQNNLLPNALKITIKSALSRVSPSNPAQERPRKRNALSNAMAAGEKKRRVEKANGKSRLPQGRCGSCDWKSDTKTTVKCEHCKAWTCRRHTHFLCPLCASSCAMT